MKLSRIHLALISFVAAPKLRRIVEVVTFLLIQSVCARPSPAVPQTGDMVDVVPFGEVTRWDNQGRDYGIIWEDARDISRVVIHLAETATADLPDGIRLEYWQSSWPERRIPRDELSGAGSSGWLDVGDWFQGKWVRADVNLEQSDGTWTFTFRPVNRLEFPQLADFPAKYRSCLKLRVAADEQLPEITSVQAMTDSVWKQLEFDVQWGGEAREQSQLWDGKLEIFNGHVVQVRPLLSTSQVRVRTDWEWTSRVVDGLDGIRASILAATPVGYNSFDETVVTVRAEHATFSFAATDLEKHGHIFLPDFGVLVRRAGNPITYVAAEQEWRSSREQNLYYRVGQAREQTFAGAWQDTPVKGRHYIPLSFEGGRQHFGLDPDGSVFCNWNWLNRIPGKDTKRCLFDGEVIRYRFGLSETDVVDRQLRNGYLPIVHTEWERDKVRYRQVAFVAPLAGVPQEGERIEADESLVFLCRFEMESLSESGAEAKLDLSVVAREPENLVLDDGWIIAQDGEAAHRRMLLSSPDTTSSYQLQVEDGEVMYRASLSPDCRRRTLECIIPYITLSEPGECQTASSLDFDSLLADVETYWRNRVESGTQLVTPEPMINDFYRAHVSHLLINTEREVGANDRYMAKVGTFSYGVYSNESCMMISDLDRRGYHDRVRQALQTWLHYQGTVGLPGDYTTAEGQFYGAGGYEAGGYNQHHGFVLWCLGEHYWYTRDNQWLRQAAPRIIQGCQWIVDQRQRTSEAAGQSSLRTIERGLLPPGRLEDIGDWRSWLSTNVYTWWGMQNAASALVASEISDGKRLLEEAEHYRRDILKAFQEATKRSPVVRLRDGSWIPHVPPEVHRRGRTFGWITETLEGAIHMVRTGIIEPHDRLATWIIQDYEDNLYLSKQYGYDLVGDEYERYWFSRGGISMQANLLCNPIPYLLRDEPKHFLRAYFNAFAASYFPDTRMMTEHALPNIGDWRGDHYKSSDEANSTYWLRMMYVLERGPDLWLGAAIPRDWLADGKRLRIDNARTYFGSMSMELVSHAANGSIEMVIDPPRRNPPQRILARFRHPDGKLMCRCQVNGQDYSGFNPQSESVELTGCIEPVRVVAFYD